MNELSLAAVVLVLLGMGWVESKEPRAPRFDSAREAGLRLFYLSAFPHVLVWVNPPLAPGYWGAYAFAAFSLLGCYGVVSALAFVFAAARVIAK